VPTLKQLDVMIWRAYKRLCASRRDRASPLLLKHQQAALDALLDQRLREMQR
jgi:hypothetical protein